MEIVESKNSTKTNNEDQKKNILFTIYELPIDGIDIIQIYIGEIQR